MYKKSTFLMIMLLVVGSCQENFDNRLQREAKEYTQKHCPLQIEDGNTLDSLTYDISSRNLIRWHTLSGVMDSETSKQAFANNPHLIRKQLLLELRGDALKGNCKDQNIKFSYIYRSSSTGDEIFKTTFNPDDYHR